MNPDSDLKEIQVFLMIFFIRTGIRNRIWIRKHQNGFYYVFLVIDVSGFGTGS